MHSFVRYFFPIILAFFVLTAVSGQDNFARYVNDEMMPWIDVTRFEKFEFEWNMPGKVQTFMNVGLTELDEQNYGVAIENFSEVIKLSKSFAAAYHYRGVARKAINELGLARRDLDSALLLSPKWESRLELGQVLQFANQPDAAEREYKKVLDLNPTCAYANYLLGNIEFYRGLHKKAMKYYDRCNRLDPKFAAAYVMEGLVTFMINRKISDCFGYFEKALQAQPLSRDALYWRGILWIKENQKEKALEDWTKLVEANPHTPYFRVVRAFLCIELDNFDLAFNDLRKALLENLVDENRFRASQTILDKKIDLQGVTNYAVRFSYGLQEDAFNYFKKGFCLLLSGREKSALVEFKKAEKIENSAAIFLLEGLTFEHLNKHDSALLYYDMALDLDNDIFDAHKKRGIYRYELKNYKGAYADFAHMIRLQPNSMISYRLRGMVKFQQTDYIGAVIDLTKYLKSDSTDTEVRIFRAQSFNMLKDFKRAVDDFEIALKSDSNKFDLYDVTAEAHLNAGDTSSAITTRRREAKKYRLIDPHIKNIGLLISQKKWEEALTEVESASRYFNLKSWYDKQKYSQLMTLRGIIFFRTGKYDLSIDQFTKAMKEHSKNFEAKYYRAKAYLQSGKKSDAMREFEDLKIIQYADAEIIYESLK
jgi:tetratricopeptide (TPR) repeat protein